MRLGLALGSNSSGHKDKSSHYISKRDAPPGEDAEATYNSLVQVDASPLSTLELAQIGAGKAISILTKKEGYGHCIIEDDSIYGAAVAMPQIARSCGWPGTITALVFRIYLFTVINFLLQGFLLSMIGEEQMIMYPFAGQMHLCDFGSSIPACPGSPNCKGPAGTELSYARLYSYDIWNTRMFVKQSLQALFPDKAQELEANVDPGEYGLENYWCRLVCVFLFMLALVEDLCGTVELAKTLFYVPTKDESWITYEVPDFAEKEDVKRVKDLGELDFVKFKVAGIPLHWKIFNIVFIMIPKALLWLALVKSGVHYLMETAGIVDMIVNAMALAFVLEVDEMVFYKLTSELTKHIIGNIEGLPLYDEADDEHLTDQFVLDRFQNEELGSGRIRQLWKIIPQKLFLVLALQVFFIWGYYYENCERQEDGSWVSKAMHLPKDLTYSPFKLMFGLEPEMETDSFWQMPS